MPANLEIVQLSTRGSGKVVEDNSDSISMNLSAVTAGSGMARLSPPKNGVVIGGTQSVKRYVQPAAHGNPDPAAGDLHPSGSKCSAVHVGARTGAGLALWLPLVALALASRRRRSRAQLAAVSLCTLLSLTGCDEGDVAAPARADAGGALPSGTLTREQLRDPATCKDCHPTHYREWSSSMHAYAAQDPVFVAMNRRGQRETGGELGQFCVRCHAPMAVADELTSDGLNLEQLPDRERGVSCYFCHNVTGIDGDHNAMLHLANDTTMRGPIRDPLQPGVHRAEYSEVFEKTSPKSNAMCGGCHDIVTPAGVHLERTLQEYRSGIFSKSATGAPPAFDSCAGCHMPGRQAFVAVQSAVQRTLHDHLWPGIDVPLTDFPNRDAMRSAVEDCQLGAPSVSFFTLEVTPPDLFTFQIETNAGHNQPSGAAQDRRMWLEFSAYDANGKRLDEVSSGNIANGEVEEKPAGDPKHDPHLLMFRDRIFDAQGKPVHMFWQAASSKAHPDGYESNVLPVASTTYIEGRHAVVKQYRASGPDGLPARVTARLHVRPIGLDVLQDLVESGDLDPAIAAQMPTLTFGAQIEWTKESGLMKAVSAKPNAPDCSTYRCMLDPSAQECR
jgi:hypothetical protein